MLIICVRFADEAVCIGPPASKDSYLKNPNIIAAVEITRDALFFYVNDTLTFSYPKIKGAEKQFPFGKPFYLLIDMQLGGAWVGEVENLHQPTYMYIDWVRYYKR